MSPRALLPLLLSTSLACTSTETIAPGARMALARSTTADFIRVPTADGGTIEFGPNATLDIGGTEVAASDLYMTEWGLYNKRGEPISSWENLPRTIKVEQPDGAANVAIAVTAAIAIVALAALLKSAPSGSTGSGSKGASTGGSAPKSMPTRSAPNPSPILPDPNPAVTDVAFRTIEMVAAANTNGPTVTVRTDEEETSATIPLFSRGARRRANIRALARLEGGACWPGSSGDCFVSGARIGMRLLDFFELTGGARVETTARGSEPLAVFGAMLHGEAPAAHWFALAAGASVAFNAVYAHVVPTVSARFRPFRGFWIGLVPVEPVYATETGTWSMASGMELTGEF